MTGYKAWGGEWDWCEHEHATWDDAAECAKATKRAMVVDMRTAQTLPDGSFAFTALNHTAYSTGGEVVDLSAYLRGGK